MILSSVQLKNFRSHRDTDINFSGNINYITGGNGQGKTTLLESIYYLCTTKSNIAKADADVVCFNEKNFEIKGNFNNSINNKVRIYYSAEENKKYYFKNDKQVYKAAEIIGQFPVVLLTPADHAITQGSPSDRRKFIDSVISQASETYLQNLLDYNKTLKQRSQLLNRLKEQKQFYVTPELEAWTDKLAAAGSELIKARKRFISDFNRFVIESYGFILGNDEVPGVAYNYLDGSGEEDIEKLFLEMLSRRKDEELRRASNLVGPHRDDFMFSINGLNLKTYGSQGQHKTFQVVLRFAEFFYLKEMTNRVPIFLLDDVFGELDINRSSKISSYLREVGQSFITLTDFTNLSYLQKKDDDLVLNVNSGKVSYGK